MAATPPPAAPSPGPSDDFSKNQTAAWEYLVERHQQARQEAYETRGSRERVKAEDREEILSVLVRLTEGAIAQWRAAFPQTVSGFDDAYRYLVGFIVPRWIGAYDGHDEFLRKKMHPLFALRHDLSELELEWTEHWAEHLQKSRHPNPTTRAPRAA